MDGHFVPAHAAGVREMSRFLLPVFFIIFPVIVFAEGMIWVNEYSLKEAREKHLYIDSSCKWIDRCEISVRVPSKVQGYPLSQIIVIKNNVEVPLSFSENDNGYSIGYLMVKGKKTNKLKVKLDYSEMVDQLHWNHVYAVIPLKNLELSYE